MRRSVSRSNAWGGATWLPINVPLQEVRPDCASLTDCGLHHARRRCERLIEASINEVIVGQADIEIRIKQQVFSEGNIAIVVGVGVNADRH